MHVTEDDLIAQFDDGVLNRGMDYFRSGKVMYVEEIDGQIYGEVQGSARQVYEQDIGLVTHAKLSHIAGSCTCPVGHNCKHVVAVLLAHLRTQPGGRRAAIAGAPVLPYAVSSWMQQFVRVMQGNLDTPSGKKPAFRLIYVLIPDRAMRRVSLALCKARFRVGGEISTATVLTDTYHLSRQPPDYVQADDAYPISLFLGIRGGQEFSGAVIEPKDLLGGMLVQHLLDAGKLLWAEGRPALKAGEIHAVRRGPARQAALDWHAYEDNPDFLRVGWQFEDGTPVDAVVQTSPLFYLHDATLGELVLPSGLQNFPIAQLHLLLSQAPRISTTNKTEVARQLVALGLERIVPPPQVLEQLVRHDIVATPMLRLSSVPMPNRLTGVMEWHDFGILLFDYDGEQVTYDATKKIVRQTREGSELLVRDQDSEALAYGQLLALGFHRPSDPDSPLFSMQSAVVLASQAAWLQFARNDRASLQEAGWHIESNDYYRYDLSEVDDWYADIDQGDEASSPWFDLELGIVVNQQRVALLPVLVQLIQSAPHDFNPAALAAHADDDQLLATLADGVRVALPWGRIKPILATLGELYFTEKLGTSLRISSLDAARLAELESSTQLRWLGGQYVREMGKKLLEFGGIHKLAPPRGLQATLREYQIDGLSWMQFLREYGLAGILADDMGLGKTIQALAHILLEKEAGRLDVPALVVAPTSLMSNWQAEAARFTPDLRVLLLHGPARQLHFEEMAQFDLVLTTYPLLARDEIALCKQRFHLLILDESQTIKNSRAKAAQSASLLQARHRLCLTGTPLQNHLGELWSQFHFLLPGLLGDEKTFNAEFRKPIEKTGDASRNKLLIQRIRPFLLRRTKDVVAKELPAKTEMVREVELAGAQRDLYETVRLAMDKKVRAEIAKKGAARSQIIILDALLKLRQVCCDPRLVKLNEGKVSHAPSAKLVELLEMVEALQEEGRKILVFSQFTSMLSLIADEFMARKWDFALLTGDTQDRAEQVAKFQDGRVGLFLISLKAGGVGLNLTAADTVIHYDPWWNPAAENQATDRAWRIGQDKPVFVYKLIAKGTLEEKIQVLQRKKADLANAVLVDGASTSLAITAEELQAIFTQT